MRTRIHTPIARMGLGLLGLALLPGCRLGGTMSVERANENLRRERVELDARLARLEGENAELRVKIAQARRGAAEPPPGVVDATPRCVGVEIDSLSGFAHPSGDPGRVDRIVVYVRPRDGRGRFVQAVGTLVVEAEVGGVPVPALTLDPLALREAYRSSAAGTHYAVELPCSATPGPLRLRVTFLDAQTGAEHKARRDADPLRP